METNSLLKSLFFVSLILFIACDSSEKSFKKAQNENTIQSYENFIIKYPDSELIEEAKLQIKELHLKFAIENETIEGYKEFINKYPDDKEDAKLILDEIAKENLVVISNPMGLKVFISNFDLIKESIKDTDAKSELAINYEKQGVPRTIGCNKFEKGVTPCSILLPDKNSVVCVVKTASNGDSITASCDWEGELFSAYGEANFQFGFPNITPIDWTFLLWDNDKMNSGQIQIIDSGKLKSVVKFVSFPQCGNLIDLYFNPDRLYISMSKRGIPASAIGL
jgi:hypothetical protein